MYTKTNLFEKPAASCSKNTTNDSGSDSILDWNWNGFF